MAGMLAVAVASSRTLEVLDLESTGLTNQSAQVRWLHVWGRPGVGVEISQMSADIPKGWQVGVGEATLTELILFHTLLPQTLLDMVENYPTALRSLVLAENSISPELQQQICDLLSEGEEEEEVAGGPGNTQERERGREPAAHQRGSSSWMCPSGKSPVG